MLRPEVFEDAYQKHRVEEIASELAGDSPIKFNLHYRVG
jgi:hypothetical protein